MKYRGPALGLLFLAASFLVATSANASQDCAPAWAALKSVLARHEGVRPLKSPLDDFLNSHPAPKSFIQKHDSWSSAQRTKHNERLLASLKGPWEDASRNGSLKVSLNKEDASLITRKTHRHPVVGYPNLDRYENCNQGFCFGRAVGIHVEALRMRVHPDAIRKIWIVNPESGDRFHVAGLIKSDEDGWWVLDANHMTAMTPEKWVRTYGGDASHSLFISDARRFSASQPSHYNPIDLFGTEDFDFYNRFFSDYFSRYPL
jgi:hypothetical protein